MIAVIKREFLPSCESCKAFMSMNDDRDPDAGFCRRNPPQAFTQQTRVPDASGKTQTQVVSQFPPVSKGMLCMEWRPSEAIVKEAEETARAMAEAEQQASQGKATN